MRDELLELVMSKASGMASEEELHRIDAILEMEPQLWEDYNQWHRDMPALRGVMCLAAATAEDRHRLPDHIREELRARMRAALRKPQPNYGRIMELVNEPPNPRPSWRWAVAPAVGLAAIVVISLVLFNNRPDKDTPAQQPNGVANHIPVNSPQPALPAAPVIQVALLDSAGLIRGTEPPVLKQLQAAWPKAEVQQFTQRVKSIEWLAQWPTATDPVCKIYYNHGSGELRLVARIEGQQRDATYSLPENNVSNLPHLIQQAQAQVAEWLQ